VAQSGRRSRGVKQAGFVVLKETTMPSILAEIGFLSSPKEEGFLKTEEGQWDVVQDLAMAFAEYKQILENESYTLGGNNEVIASIPLDGKQVETTATSSNGPLIPVNDQVRQVPAPQPAATYPAPEPPRADFNRIPISVPAEPEKRIVIRSPYEQGTEVTPTGTSQAANTIPSSAANGSSRLVRKAVPTPPPTATYAIDQRDLLFCVQLAASPKPLNTEHPRWADVTYRIEVVREGDYYKYQARSFPSIVEAEKAKAHLQHQGFIDAFVVIYRGGERLSSAETKMLVEQLGVDK
ncbi:MAG: N-acetylmuramoyl-L-alanine amidase, partial [Lewinella sp.]|nr:N-acetylmuramoyl-L-alanine amidase [Lewinella sp.]